MIRRPPRSTLFPSPTLFRSLIGVSPTDPMTYAAVAAVLSGVTLLACWLPARRGLRVDPIAPAERVARERKSTRLNSSHANISYAILCFEQKKDTSRHG